MLQLKTEPAFYLFNVERNLFKISNKDTRTMSNNVVFVFAVYCYLLTNFTYCSGISIVDFEQVKTDWKVC